MKADKIVKILGLTTRIYRIALVLVGAVGATLVIIQNAGDVSDPAVWLGIAISVGPIVVAAIRNIEDPATPTLPTP